MSIASRAVRRMFDLPADRPGVRCYIPDPLITQLVPAPGRVTLITGASGGGKSRLLQEIQTRSAPASQWIDPRTIELLNRPVIDIVCDAIDPVNDDLRIPAALDLLSRVGLAEAWTYLQEPCSLSDGQRWRLILALAVIRAQGAADRSGNREGSAGSTAIIAMDEFAALLDRVTAAVVAQALRRLCDRSATLGAIVVTSHDDIAMALSPDIHVVCDFGMVRVVHPASAAAQNSNRRQNNNRQQNASNNQKRLE